jgi:hypothetical protein
MSRITDLIAIDYIARNHCADPTCPKCIARFRWLRRKAWRTSKTPARKSTERK